jgi:hypothetical protein
LFQLIPEPDAAFVPVVFLLFTLVFVVILFISFWFGIPYAPGKIIGRRSFADLNKHSKWHLPLSRTIYGIPKLCAVPRCTEFVPDGDDFPEQGDKFLLG